MAYDPNCVFCKIINGEIPSAKVYENDDVYAFLDLSQVTKGHTLVVPKKHQKDIFHLEPETAAALFRNIPKIANAIKEAFNPLGLNMLNNNGEFAGQSVFHYHVHLIPRYGKEDGFEPIWITHDKDYTSEQRAEVAAKIAEHLK